MINGNIINELGDTIIIKLVEPYKKVKSILSYADVIDGEDSNNYFAKFFRWSTDNKNFSEFIELSDINLQKVILDSSNDFWIEYKYEAVELDTGNSLEFISISLEVITDDGRIFDQLQVNINTCDPNDPSCVGNLIIEDCCDNENTFNPYDWANKATSLYNQLTEVTTKLFGHCVDYYRVVPDKDNRDPFLKEDTIFNRNIKREIKVLVPDNQFPSNEIQFDPFLGMTSEGFEVHITRKEFEEAFGANERPRERDSLYIPLNQRKYEVSSVMLSDEIHYMHAYWRVKLTKWEDKANIYNSPEIEDELEELTVSMDDAFSADVEEEFLKITKPQQYRTIGLGDNDHIRKEINPDITIIDEKINNNWTVVSKNYYDLSKLPKNSIALKYRSTVNLNLDENRAFTFWFKSKLPIPKPRILIDSISDNNGLLQVTTSSENIFQVGDIIEFTNLTNYNNTIFYISSIIDSYNFVVDTAFINSQVVSSSRVGLKDSATILYGYDTNTSSTGISIEMLNGYIHVSINNESYIFNIGISEYNPDLWYSVVLNLSNNFKQLGLYLYKLEKPLTYINPQSQDTSLDLMYSEVKELDESININNNVNWSLLGGSIYLTNIRIFSNTIEEESRELVLNQYVVRDTQLASLIDNAVVQLKLLKLSNPR
jgi:hypothetical protein